MHGTSALAVIGKCGSEKAMIDRKAEYLRMMKQAAEEQAAADDAIKRRDSTELIDQHLRRAQLFRQLAAKFDPSD